jgi:hypothetical protein
MEGADSFKERDKVVTSALKVIRPVRLSVYDFLPRSDEQDFVKMLTKRSGLNVDRGGSLSNPYGLKLYAYFNDEDSANAAALAVVRISYCRTRVRRGTFDVTHLMRDSRTGQPPEDLKQQGQFSRKRSTKESLLFMNAIKWSKIEQHYKGIKNIIMILIDHIIK